MTRNSLTKTSYEAALHLLKYRGQSEEELRRKLKIRGYESGDIEKTIHRLKEYRYIDDESLSEDLFNALRNRHCYGDTYIHQKMKARGLRTDRHLTYEDEFQDALHLVQVKCRIFPHFLDHYRKAAAFLQRRGFSSAVTRAVLAEFTFTD